MTQSITINGVEGIWTPIEEKKEVFETQYSNQYSAGVGLAARWWTSVHLANMYINSNRIGMIERVMCGEKIVSVRLLEKSEYENI